MGQEPSDNHPVAGMFYIFHCREDGRPRACRIEVRGHFETAEQAARFWNTPPPNSSDAMPDAMREIVRLRLATDEGTLRVRADRIWEIATSLLAEIDRTDPTFPEIKHLNERAQS
ncbi:MAG: hypothetical protein JWN66_4996 [Sphingomonas bacterium]|uniref:hypothetical protein n=1 Tax=Sphingomonas bacterium TaxID=1895847 RepID=UPI0026184194|nr:hypothetical protein [Sphingomonas bacterium]MDB5707880.1 hypothetical protein [Sphingomonas bacterium]